MEYISKTQKFLNYLQNLGFPTIESLVDSKFIIQTCNDSEQTILGGKVISFKLSTLKKPKSSEGVFIFSIKTDVTKVEIWGNGDAGFTNKSHYYIYRLFFEMDTARSIRAFWCIEPRNLEITMKDDWERLDRKKTGNASVYITVLEKIKKGDIIFS